MTTISFKAEDDLQSKLYALARLMGINISACIKLLLTKSLRQELLQIKENGLTVAEELEILLRHNSGKRSGPFTDIASLKKSLQS